MLQKRILQLVNGCHYSVPIDYYYCFEQYIELKFKLCTLIDSPGQLDNPRALSRYPTESSYKFAGGTCAFDEPLRTLVTLDRADLVVEVLGERLPLTPGSIRVTSAVLPPVVFFCQKTKLRIAPQSQT